MNTYSSMIYELLNDIYVELDYPVSLSELTANLKVPKMFNAWVDQFKWKLNGDDIYLFACFLYTAPQEFIDAFIAEYK